MSRRLKSKKLTFPVSLTKEEATWIADWILEGDDVPPRMHEKFVDLLTKFEKAERYYQAVNANTSKG